MFSIGSDGSNYQIVHVFNGASEGSFHYSGLLQVGATLYGTASGGPQGLGGSVYSLTLPVPQVTGVQVSSSDWTPAYLNALQGAGMGNGLGYAIPVGSTLQTQSLPWGNIDQIQITFNENVTVEQASLALTGLNVSQYAFSAFHYDYTTFTATWTLANPIAADKLHIALVSSGANGVVDNLGMPLNGQWSDNVSSYPSGSGLGGSDFNFGFSVLPGDANQDGIVNGLDIAEVASNWLHAGGILGDTNGDNVVNGLDIAAIASSWLTTLPAGSNANAASVAAAPLPLSIAPAFTSPPTVDRVAAFVGPLGHTATSPATGGLSSQREVQAAFSLGYEAPSSAARHSGKSSTSLSSPLGTCESTAEIARASSLDGDLLHTLSISRAIGRTPLK